MALIFAASSVSRVPEIARGVNDKTAHILEYAGLGVVTMRALARGAWAGVGLRAVLGTLLIAVAYGLSDELHQLFVPNRQFDVHDLAADAIGAGAAAVVVWTWGIIKRFSGSKSGRA
jgi:VanZ family protein